MAVGFSWKRYLSGLVLKRAQASQNTCDALDRVYCVGTAQLAQQSHPSQPMHNFIAMRVQAREGLIKDAEGRDLPLSAPSHENEKELVDYEGMLVTGAMAQRRG